MTVLEDTCTVTVFWEKAPRKSRCSMGSRNDTDNRSENAIAERRE
jgi:hypothetical protein